MAACLGMKKWKLLKIIIIENGHVLESSDNLLTPAGKLTNAFSSLFSLIMAERSEAKSAKRSFASKYFEFLYLTRSFGSRF